MRNLLRNTQPVFYRLYEGEKEILGPWGESTGLYVPKYGPLKSAMIFVSPSVGTAEAEMFGTLIQYDKTMSTADTKLEIDEDDVLWIDNADTDGPWNYIVKAVRRWKNSVSYAIQQVTVSAYNAQQKQIQEMKAKAQQVIDQQIAQHEVDNAENKAEP